MSEIAMQLPQEGRKNQDSRCAVTGCLTPICLP